MDIYPQGGIMLTIRNLSVECNHRCLLHSISLSIAPASIFSITGPNGAGKSTLLRTLAGIIPCNEGHLFFQDQDISSFSPKQRAQVFAYLPQSMPDSLSYQVEDVVALGNYPWKDHCDPADVRCRIQEAMNLCQIEEFRSRKVNTLSGGERQRVFLAQAVVQNTPVLMLDEPAVFLDLKHQILFERILIQLQEENKLILYVSHDLLSTRRIATHAAALKNGRILAHGEPKSVLSSSGIADLFDTEPDVIRQWYGDNLMEGD